MDYPLDSRPPFLSHAVWVAIADLAGVSYCLMLTFGSFALADYNTYGVGVMEVGTFYALCKIYLSALESEAEIS